jgi:hypothetical protein
LRLVSSFFGSGSLPNDENASAGDEATALAPEKLTDR